MENEQSPTTNDTQDPGAALPPKRTRAGLTRRPPKAADVARPVGRPKDGPRPVKRSDGIYQAVGLPHGRKVPLGTRDLKAAWRRLGEVLTEIAETKDGGKREIPLRDVIKAHGHDVDRSIRDHLLRFWGAVRLEEVSKSACWAYGDMREEELVERTGEKTMVNTIRKELGWFRTIVNRYCDKHKVSPPPIIHLPPRTYGRDFIRVSEVRRLLEAAVNGWIWDGAAAEWTRSADGRRARMPDAWLAEVWPMRRMITMVVNTASRIDTVAKIGWTDTGLRPWIDFRVGNLRRRGSREKPTKKRRPPQRLLPALLVQLRAWKAQDEAQGVDLVIHDLDGRPVGSRIYLQFAMVREAAGLPPTVKFKTLRAVGGRLLDGGGAHAGRDGAVPGQFRAGPFRVLRPLHREVLVGRGRRARLPQLRRRRRSDAGAKRPPADGFHCGSAAGMQSAGKSIASAVPCCPVILLLDT